jgi:hypothetical protein
MILTAATALLHWMLQQAGEHEVLSPVELPSSRLRTSLYADDVALFVNPIEADIHTVAKFFKLFG